MISRRPIVCLFGPTAVGKTELLLSLFRGQGEVVVADSLQVYRYLDIGSAKPNTHLRSQLTHHLLDVCDPDQQFHAGRFVELAEIAIQQIVAAGSVPIVSGGAAFYLRQLLYGLPRTPLSDPAIRDALQTRLQNEGRAVLYDELRMVDPHSAARIHPSDAYRILRALEVFQTSGRPLSTFRPPTRPRSDLTLLLIGLRRPAAELQQRIAARVEQMFAQGLVAELQRLLDMGYRPSDPGLRGIGYREFFADGGIWGKGCTTRGTLRSDTQPHSGAVWHAAAAGAPQALHAIEKRIVVNTLHYAKRQRTFFRALPDVHWLDADDRAGLRRLLSTA